MRVSGLSVFTACFLILGAASLRAQPTGQPFTPDQPIVELKEDEARVLGTQAQPDDRRACKPN